MGYVSTWQNSRTLGRPNDDEAAEQKDIEMASIPNTSEEKKDSTESKPVVETFNDSMAKTTVTPVTPAAPVATVATVATVDDNVQK